MSYKLDINWTNGTLNASVLPQMPHRDIMGTIGTFIEPVINPSNPSLMGHKGAKGAIRKWAKNAPIRPKEE